VSGVVGTHITDGQTKPALRKRERVGPGSAARDAESRGGLRLVNCRGPACANVSVDIGKGKVRAGPHRTNRERISKRHGCSFSACFSAELLAHVDGAATVPRRVWSRDVAVASDSELVLVRGGLPQHREAVALHDLGEATQGSERPLVDLQGPEGIWPALGRADDLGQALARLQRDVLVGKIRS